MQTTRRFRGAERYHVARPGDRVLAQERQVYEMARQLAPEVTRQEVHEVLRLMHSRVMDGQRQMDGIMASILPELQRAFPAHSEIAA